LNEFTSLGIENTSITTIADMVSLENSGKAFDILLKIAKSHQGGLAA
jgi:hypothetical protein